MTAIKTTLILILIFSFILSSYGQKIRYRNIKNEYSTNNYRETIVNPRYSPLAAGVLNYIVPSSGYFYVGEPIRGAIVLGSLFCTVGVFSYGLIMSMSSGRETCQSMVGARTVMFSGMIATGLIQIWSIYDVVKIAKIKNLAFQNTKVSINVRPDLLLVNQNDRNFATYGLRLSLSF